MEGRTESSPLLRERLKGGEGGGKVHLNDGKDQLWSHQKNEGKLLTDKKKKRKKKKLVTAVGLEKRSGRRGGFLVKRGEGTPWEKGENQGLPEHQRCEKRVNVSVPLSAGWWVGQHPKKVKILTGVREKKGLAWKRCNGRSKLNMLTGRCRRSTTKVGGNHLKRKGGGLEGGGGRALGYWSTSGAKNKTP